MRSAAPRLSYKEISIDTGLSPTSIWRIQQRLARRLGGARRIQLIAALRGTTSLEIPEESALTRSEREVANLALQGESSVNIARHRGVAVRTIVNQLSSAFHKLGVRSRSELAAFVAVPTPSPQA